MIKVFLLGYDLSFVKNSSAGQQKNLVLPFFASDRLDATPLPNLTSA